MSAVSYYRIGDETVSADEHDVLDLALTGARSAGQRPTCLCRPPTGIPMYTAKVGDTEHPRLIIKRMPGTGPDHHPDCASYIPPAGISGAGQVHGTAIDENPDDGTTTLRLSFSLAKTGGASPPEPSGQTGDSVHSDGTKLTLRGLLHYLWDEAELTRWHPGLGGRRSWAVVHRRLREAADGKTTKKIALGARLYIPEPFHPDHKKQITARRRALFDTVATSAAKRTLLMVVGEVKDLSPSRFGHKMVLKHVPDCPFMVPEDMARRIGKRFAAELEMWDAFDDMRMIVAGTVAVSRTGIPAFETLTLMPVTADWIPFEDPRERDLLEALTTERRRFVKSLRYNLAPEIPLAAAVLTDTDPTGLYIVHDGATTEEPSEDEDAAVSPSAAVDELIGESRLASWTWHTSEPLPALPAAANTAPTSGAASEAVADAV